MLPPDSQPVCRAVGTGPSFGLGALLLVICLLAFCLGLGRVDPLLGMLAAMMAAPALTRTADVIRRMRRGGNPPGNGHKLVIFLASLGLIGAALGTTAGIALALAGTGGLCGWGLAIVIDAPWLPVVASVWGLVLGLPAGLAAATLIVQRWWTC
jgi:hypothetical protein